MVQFSPYWELSLRTDSAPRHGQFVYTEVLALTWPSPPLIHIEQALYLRAVHADVVDT